ncbi:bestrophin family protein [Pacificoceanicola onchidii]|uniref:bestrophin family protein n=1 Tax=Pacificoceanicola onchidii TaxID=2562685 RepID=UPI0010A58B03|nr:bestrophin family ion channel [Pacificoceanicola onchidii]
MIVRTPRNYLDLLIAMQGSVLPQVLPKIIGFALLSVLLEALFLAGAHLPQLPLGPMAGIGIALSLFLGFRNNAAYDRWWEGRKLWGQIVGDIRSFCRESDVLLTDGAVRIRTLETLHDFIGALAAPKSPGAEVALDRVAAVLAAETRTGRLSEIGAMTLLNRLAGLTSAQVGIERLKATPLPFVYSLLIHRTVFVYCTLLPFAVFAGAGWFSPILTGVTAYVFLGLAAVTDCLEDPFAESDHAVPVNALEAICKRKLETAMGRSDLTPLVETKDYVLK